MQTVWLEAVPSIHPEQVVAIPDVDTGSVDINVHGSPAAAGSIVFATVHDPAQDNVTVGSGLSYVDISFNVPIVSNAHLWSPADPHLYNIFVYIFEANITFTNWLPTFGNKGVLAAPRFDPADVSVWYA